MRLDVHNSDVPRLCLSCEARHRGVCGVLEPSQLVRLSRHTVRHEAAPGAELLAPGEPVRRYSNILAGVVKLTMTLPDGRQQIVGLQFAPDFLGRPFAQTSEVRAEAAGFVRLCSFPRETLEELMREAPALHQRLHEQALRELDDARGWMLTLGRKSASERVASFLLLVARRADPEEQGESAFDIPLGRADIADFLGLTEETVSRQVTSLRKAGIISLETSRSLVVADHEALRNAAGEGSQGAPSSRRSGRTQSRS
ncbi:Crp/Fnr family transcriptional regulator [Rubellimicrobium rubrum]|uniref:Crp/Fnr family transcriptional regulator n=1 Tax=Rubellimicrobium rubrum TaxID=2585369 RepID=A0A5C4MXX4_9RHOB|nr:Crp/Fnr family transcriptional regulator [Rubellimicrobium rubrum]TNC49597.1 Crp/Fnr family transcriptional regulator [Rubellimicrobium rubrum]